MKKIMEKSDHGEPLASEQSAHPTIELRIDDKGFIYSKNRHANHLPIDEDEYAQFCQMIGCIALMEMKDKSRVIH